eukprot:TRINITY_DN8787_c0_g1_i2.p1 TRINITY_DN8787_c0_g1~~TRINITY_DN8787_c0_g1_i2.p1  ORF type:complete len:879 (+),score=275.15 TRINITY_DN8787_c0_g1_i2:107-2743(+)
MAEFVELLRTLLSADNALRGAAELRYAALKKEQPGTVVSSFLQVLAEGERLEAPIREQAAVLLRQCLAKAGGEKSIWSRLGVSPSQAEVKEMLLKILELEPADKVRRKVADCVQSLGSQLIDVSDDERPANAEEWPQLLPTLLRIMLDASKLPGVRGDALWAVSEMTMSIWRILVASPQQMLQVLARCLEDTAEVVRSNAACLLCQLVTWVEKASEKAFLLPLLPALFKVVAQLAECGEHHHLKTVLQAMGMTTEDSAVSYKEVISTHLLPVLTPIAKSHRDDEVRRLALEVLASIFEGKTKVMIKEATFLPAILDICTHFILELEDDLEAWKASDSLHETSNEEEEQHDFGAEVLDRICAAAKKADKFPQAMEALQPLIAKLFQQPAWKSVVAGLVVLRQVMEYVEEEALVLQMLTPVRAQFQATNERVRAAAWGCLQQAAQDHSELVTGEDRPKQLLTEILQGLADPCHRVVLACMNAYEEYGEHTEREDLEPFVQPLMERFGQRLQCGHAAVQREAITCIAVTASQIQGSAAGASAAESVEASVGKAIVENTSSAAGAEDDAAPDSKTGAVAAASGKRPEKKAELAAEDAPARKKPKAAPKSTTGGARKRKASSDTAADAEGCGHADAACSTSAEVVFAPGAEGGTAPMARFTDVAEDPSGNLPPIVGVMQVPTQSVQQCVQATGIQGLEAFAWMASENGKKLSKGAGHGLEADEAGAINLYTMESDLYPQMNACLRSCDRQQLKRYFPFLKLMLLARAKLPTFSGTVWRGVKADLRSQYSKGLETYWWAFSSTTKQMSTLTNPKFLGKTGERTIFNLQVRSGTDISLYSVYKDAEAEVLVFPGTKFRVVDVLDAGNGLCMVHMEEVEVPVELVK